MSMYIRLKRKNQTLFLHVEPSNSFLQIKQKISDVVRIDPTQIQLYHSDKRKEFLDNGTISDQEVKNDDVVYMIFMKETGGWEDIQVDNLIPISTSGDEMAC